MNESDMELVEESVDPKNSLDFRFVFGSAMVFSSGLILMIIESLSEIHDNSASTSNMLLGTVLGLTGAIGIALALHKPKVENLPPPRENNFESMTPEEQEMFLKDQRETAELKAAARKLQHEIEMYFQLRSQNGLNGVAPLHIAQSVIQATLDPKFWNNPIVIQYAQNGFQRRRFTGKTETDKPH